METQEQAQIVMNTSDEMVSGYIDTSDVVNYISSNVPLTGTITNIKVSCPYCGMNYIFSRFGDTEIDEQRFHCGRCEKHFFIIHNKAYKESGTRLHTRWKQEDI